MILLQKLVKKYKLLFLLVFSFSYHNYTNAQYVEYDRKEVSIVRHGKEGNDTITKFYWGNRLVKVVKRDFYWKNANYVAKYFYYQNTKGLIDKIVVLEYTECADRPAKTIIKYNKFGLPYEIINYKLECVFDSLCISGYIDCHARFKNYKMENDSLFSEYQKVVSKYNIYYYGKNSLPQLLCYEGSDQRWNDSLGRYIYGNFIDTCFCRHRDGLEREQKMIHAIKKICDYKKQYFYEYFGLESIFLGINSSEGLMRKIENDRRLFRPKKHK